MAIFFRWIVDIAGAPGTLYAGEQFQLQFKFGQRYPFESPQVFLITWQYIQLKPGFFQINFMDLICIQEYLTVKFLKIYCILKCYLYRPTIFSGGVYWW